MTKLLFVNSGRWFRTNDQCSILRSVTLYYLLNSVFFFINCIFTAIDGKEKQNSIFSVLIFPDNSFLWTVWIPSEISKSLRIIYTCSGFVKDRLSYLLGIVLDLFLLFFPHRRTSKHSIQPRLLRLIWLCKYCIRCKVFIHRWRDEGIAYCGIPPGISSVRPHKNTTLYHGVELFK